MKSRCMPTRGEGEEDEGEDEEDLEEGEETSEAENEETRTRREKAETSRRSHASTAEERDTSPPPARAKGSREGINETGGTGTMKEEDGRPLP